MPRGHPAALQSDQDRANSFRFASTSSEWASLSSSTTSMYVVHGSSSWFRRDRASTGINPLRSLQLICWASLHCRAGSQLNYNGSGSEYGISQCPQQHQRRRGGGFGRIEGIASLLEVGSGDSITTIQPQHAWGAECLQSLSLVPDWLRVGPRIPTPHPSSASIGPVRSKTSDSHHYKQLERWRCLEGRQICRMDFRRDVYIYGVDMSFKWECVVVVLKPQG